MWSKMLIRANEKEKMRENEKRKNENKVLNNEYHRKLVLRGRREKMQNLTFQNFMSEGMTSQYGFLKSYVGRTSFPPEILNIILRKKGTDILGKESAIDFLVDKMANFLFPREIWHIIFNCEDEGTTCQTDLPIYELISQGHFFGKSIHGVPYGIWKMMTACGAYQNGECYCKDCKNPLLMVGITQFQSDDGSIVSLPASKYNPSMFEREYDEREVCINLPFVLYKSKNADGSVLFVGEVDTYPAYRYSITTSRRDFDYRYHKKKKYEKVFYDTNNVLLINQLFGFV
jgi:hypothetical protein